MGFLKWIECRDAEVKTEDLQEYAGGHGLQTQDVAWLNHQLYQVLSLNTSGPALAQVQNLEEDIECNGANSWWKLLQEHQGVSGQRMSGLADRVFKPSRAKKYQDCGPLIESWEMRVREYVRAVGVPGCMPDIAKIHALKQLVPEELAKDMTKAVGSMRTYEDAKRFVMEQILARKDAWFPKDQGVVPMQLDMAHGGESQENEEEEEQYDENGNLLALKGTREKGKEEKVVNLKEHVTIAANTGIESDSADKKMRR